MTKKMYAQLLLREEWLKKREEILERDGYRCVKCGATKLLQVHHKKYGDGMPWEVPNSWLVTLCKGCHSLEHGIFKSGKTKKRKIKRKKSRVKVKHDMNVSGL